jgi:hypothetical protein
MLLLQFFSLRSGLVSERSCWSELKIIVQILKERRVVLKLAVNIS